MLTRTTIIQKHMRVPTSLNFLDHSVMLLTYQNDYMSTIQCDPKNLVILPHAQYQFCSLRVGTFIASVTTLLIFLNHTVSQTSSTSLDNQKKID